MGPNLGTLHFFPHSSAISNTHNKVVVVAALWSKCFVRLIWCGSSMTLSFLSHTTVFVEYNIRRGPIVGCNTVVHYNNIEAELDYGSIPSSRSIVFGNLNPFVPHSGSHSPVIFYLTYISVQRNFTHLLCASQWADTKQICIAGKRVMDIANHEWRSTFFKTFQTPAQ